MKRFLNKKFGMIILTTSTIIFYANKLVNYKIQHVHVYGNIITNIGTITSNLKNQKMIRLNTKLEEMKIKKLIGVKHCTIKKIWPHSIVVLIEEHIPVFQQNDNYISIEGLKIGKTYPIDRIHLFGKYDEYELTNLMHILLKYQNILDNINSIHRVRSERFDIILNSGITLKCGDQKVESSIMRYLNLPKNIPNTKIIDFRHPQRTIFYNETNLI